MHDDFTQCYAVLGLADGSGWQAVRRAYRKSIQKWHPDRFNEGADRQSAEKRTIEINAAYQTLERYYDTHGVTPSRPAPTPARTAVTPAQPSDTATETVRAPDTARPATPEPSAAIRKPSRAYVFVILTCLIVLLIYHIVDTDPVSEPFGEHSAAVPENKTPAARAGSDPRTSTFMVGSTPGRVYAVQGVPTHTAADIWYYGKSKIYFQKGAVSHWENHPDNPLNASASGQSHNAPLDFFTYGSTKSEVRAVQGQPWQESETVWEYGSSKIYFKAGQVTSWEESPYFPLKVTH